MYFRSLRDILDIKRQWTDPDLLQKAQEERLGGILQAASQTRYYGRMIDCRADSLADFPVTEKDEVHKNPDSFIRDGLNKEDLRLLRTSGSTGEPIKIFTDRESLLFRRWLVYIISLELGRSPFDLVARIGSRGPYQKPRFDSRLGLFRNLCLHANEDVREILSLVRSNGANIVAGYPSVVSLLAKANLENPIRLKSVFCGAEMLTKDYKKIIEESFSCPVFNDYGCWEFGPIAWECPEEHSLHVNSNSVVLEIVDSKGKPKNSGIGEVLLTSLQNRAMPLMRYRIGDLASWGKECPCGRSLPVLKSIEGRCDDMITLPSGRKITPMAIMVEYKGEIYRGIWAYQIIQERPDLFVVRIVPTKEGFRYEKEMTERIKEACYGEKIDVEIEIVDKIQREGGKLRRVISKVK